MSLTLESSIFEYFCQLEDPRVNRTKLHKLIDIVAIAILAVIGGADGWEAIETSGNLSRMARTVSRSAEWYSLT